MKRPPRRSAPDRSTPLMVAPSKERPSPTDWTISSLVMGEKPLLFSNAFGIADAKSGRHLQIPIERSRQPCRTADARMKTEYCKAIHQGLSIAKSGNKSTLFIRFSRFFGSFDFSARDRYKIGSLRGDFGAPWQDLPKGGGLRLDNPNGLMR